MERVKILIGNEDFSSVTNSGPASLATTNALRSFLTKKQEMDQVLEDEQGNKSEATTPLGPKQAWMEADLSLEDASIIEDIDEIPKDREPQSLTGGHATRCAISCLMTINEQFACPLTRARFSCLCVCVCVRS